MIGLLMLAAASAGFYVGPANVPSVAFVCEHPFGETCSASSARMIYQGKRTPELSREDLLAVIDIMLRDQDRANQRAVEEHQALMRGLERIERPLKNRR